MNPYRSERFAQRLPLTPLNQHLASLHALLIHLGAEDYVLQVGEEHLRRIAQFTSASTQPQGYRPPEFRYTPPTLPDFADMSAAIMKAAEGVTRQVAKLRDRREQLLKSRAADREGRDKLRYQNRIATERQVGLDHVQAEARRVRKELGFYDLALTENRSTP